MRDFIQEEKDNLVNVFTWLIEQDKKQNPENYKKGVIFNNDGEEITL